MSHDERALLAALWQDGYAYRISLTDIAVSGRDLIRIPKIHGVIYDGAQLVDTEGFANFIA
jgi:hypothetical protein